MRVLSLPGREPGDAAGTGGAAVTIGAYDGVHLGHRELIARTREDAARRSAVSAVVTFDRHPATVVRPDSAPLLLTDTEQKLELLAATGVDLTLLVRFDAERAAEPPESFVRDVLVGVMEARSVVVGDDFHFGRDRRGNVELLARMGRELGFDVTGASLRQADGGPVSSTRIRKLVARGDVREARVLLGRYHQVRGVVAHGDGRGRELGFPTANLTVPAGIAVPADGVYAAWFTGGDGVRRKACVSVGRRPTFYAESGEVLVEAHLLGWDGDLYGQRGRVDFVARQRGQERFDSAGALVRQMARDVEDARRLLDDELSGDELSGDGA